jgi:hypothetical protein
VNEVEKGNPTSVKKSNVMDPSSSSQSVQMESRPSMVANNSKMQEVVQQVGQNPKGALVAFDAGLKTQVEHTGKVCLGDNLKTIVEVSEEDTENSYENRVQGLSGNNMLDSKDDLLSDDFHEGPADLKMAGDKLNIGLVRCSESVLHQSDKGGGIFENRGNKHDAMGNEKLDGKPQALMISDKQKIPKIRCSARLEQQWLGKIQEKQKSADRKRTLEGTNLSSKNSFVVLDNELIASIALDMGISIPDDQFDSIDMMKDIELARHAIDVAKKKVCSVDEEVEEECCNETIGVPLLEWIEEDFESESFTLVQSRKKKEKIGEVKTGVQKK